MNTRKSQELKLIKIDEELFRNSLPQRKTDAHKGDFGRVLIFAGSCGMAGAAVLAGSAAVRSGAGLVRFLLPSFADPIYPVLQTCVPEATCITPEGIGFYGRPEEDSEDPCHKLNEYTAIAAGSGLGGDPARQNILRYLIRNYSGTLVLDADALNAVASGAISLDDITSSPASLIFTPHIGEAKRLLHTAASIRTEAERITAAKEIAETYRCTALLKGPKTLVVSALLPESDPKIFENTTGNPGMAAGGSGDVLSGIIAALAGQGLSPEIAAACGAFIHGKAGDIAASRFSQISMKAGDIIACLPNAFF